MNTKLWAILFTGLSLTITGCGKLAKKVEQTVTPEAQSASTPAAQSAAAPASADDAWSEKVNAYIKVNNRTAKFLSTTNSTFAEWRARDAEKVAKGDFKAIRTDTHTFDSGTIQNLKAAVAMAGQTPEIDQAANELIAAVEQYLPVWQELVDYNKSKKYEDDNGTKGKNLLASYREGFGKIEAAVKNLDAQVDAAAKKEHEKTLAKFKAEGKLLEMHTWQAMGSAEKIVETFNSNADLKNPAKIEAANKNLADMEASVASLKTEHAARKASGDKSLPMIDRYDSIVSDLTELAGHYREARKDPSKLNDAIDDYNDAVDDLNMMNR